MKLIEFKQKKEYHFILKFMNGEVKEVDLKELIGKHVSLIDLKSAKLNEEWGCLEFKSGMVDIEPKTLYKYASQKTILQGKKVKTDNVKKKASNY